MSKNMFGMEEPQGLQVPPPTSAEETPPYVVTSMLPAVGWYAIFEDEKNQTYTRNLACFGLVQTIVDGSLTQLVRPLVADDDGSIVDVDAFEDFLVLVPPSDRPFTVPLSAIALIEDARKRRDEADK